MIPHDRGGDGLDAPADADLPATAPGRLRARRRLCSPAAAGILLFLAPVLGPTTGGLGFVGAQRISTDLAVHSDRTARFDPLSLFLVGGGLALTLYGTTTATRMSWLAMLLVAAVGVIAALFVRAPASQTTI